MNKSQKQEKKIAEKISGRTHPFSGGLDNWKEDASSEKFLVQCKRSDKKQIIIKLSDLEQLRNNASKQDKEPIFAIQIGEVSWFLIGENLLEELL